MKAIYFAGGCFWGTQKYFDQFDGVIRTEVGYANGSDDAPSYQDVCANSGHAETVLVEFDESVISPEKLIYYYFLVIDPTSVNRQGHDVGIQYRTGIYYSDPDMLDAIRRAYDKEEELIGKPLAVEVKPLANFFTAEEYHQKYLDKNPSGYCHIPAEFFTLNGDK
ncbi:MAG: peptide-methionine (S)-S-oxide reductase MsrA [Oscillospiraceae bacterium]|nr:peptide-methionine (S)-S-oxide reductase MsrA [Oscillospiraceae bacterium]